MESLVPDLELIVATITATAFAGSMALLTILAFFHLRQAPAREPIQARRIGTSSRS